MPFERFGTIIASPKQYEAERSETTESLHKAPENVAHVLYHGTFLKFQQQSNQTGRFCSEPEMLLMNLAITKSILLESESSAVYVAPD